MRIIQGRWGGRQLTSPGRAVRPTSEEVRGAALEAVADELEGGRILDLFAGSGALGLEALSRGAAHADFVENGAPALHALKANLAALRVGSRARLFKRDAIPFVEALPALSYDVAFADPPYGSRKLDRVVARWLRQPFSRVLCVEHEKSHRLSGRATTLRFGDTSLRIYRTRSPEDATGAPLASEKR